MPTINPKRILLLACLIAPFFAVLTNALSPIAEHDKSTPRTREKIYREEFLTWEEFLCEYMNTSQDEEGGGSIDVAEVEDLAERHANPVNINRATREELLFLPFMDEALTDSLLAYRERHHNHLITLGELMFVHGMSYNIRRYLSLFIYVGEVPPNEISSSQSGYSKNIWHPDPPLNVWRDGHHDVVSLFNIPLYHIAGFDKHTPTEAREHPKKYYTGMPFGNTTRYEYRCAQALRYGLTLQNDTGEPFGRRGTHTYPFDYNSFYFYIKPQNKELTLIAGDYRVRSGSGLLLGNSTWGGRTALLSNNPNLQMRISPHCSANEYNFFRGVAFQYNLQELHRRKGQRIKTQITAFVSARRLDATVNNGTVSSLQSDGLHRTIKELEDRNRQGCLVGGTQVSMQTDSWQIGLTSLWTQFSIPIQPIPQKYNKYYLRGRNAFGISATYKYKWRKFIAQGETAMDKHAALATTNTFRWKPTNSLIVTLHGRILSPQFTSPWARVITQSSRTQNEQAALLGFRWIISKKCLAEAYAEYYRMPLPSYRCDSTRNGVETYLKIGYNIPVSEHKNHTLNLKYKGRIYQQNVLSKYIKDHNIEREYLLEYIKNVSLSLQWNYVLNNFHIGACLEGKIYATQTYTPDKGFAASFYGQHRVKIKRNINLSTAASIGVFATDSYNSRQYIYKPTLNGITSPYTSESWGALTNISSIGISMLYGKGITTTIVIESQLAKNIAAGIRHDFTSPFSPLSSSMKNTLGAYVRVRI